MPACLWFLLILASLSLSPAMGADEFSAEIPAPVALEFGGYQFGQSPAANMLCLSGYCKSQAPGGDGRITFPFSVYETPGAVSTLAGINVVNARYTFWEDHLYRIYFQADCAPLEGEECLKDIIRELDHEFGMTPIAVSDSELFMLQRRSIVRDFLTESGAMVRIRIMKKADGWQMPGVDIVDKGVADRVGSSLSPNYQPKALPVPSTLSK